MATRSPPCRRASPWSRRREHSPYAVIADEKRSFYGIQFHPEVVHTPRGAQMLPQFRARHRRHQAGMEHARLPRREVEKIRKQVGKGKVICGLSGGVDSSVAAVLIHEAIGDQLTCIFVDTGLMRAGEADEVVSLFRGHYNIPLIHADARGPVPRPARGRQRSGTEAQDHRRRLHRCVRRGKPQGRRRGIPRPGHALSRRDRKRLGHRRPVGHHQEASQCRRPARLHEAEAGRAVARTVQGRSARAGPRAGPAAGLRRPPSRSPGRASPSACPARSRARSSKSCARPTSIYLDEIRKAGLYDKIWQAFAVLLPVRTVGVMGDGRTYDHVCALRAVTSSDGMTADYYPFEHSFPGPRRHPHRQRSARHQPRGLRHDEQAARDDRVGVG